MSESLAGYVVDDFDETPSPALDRLARATHAVVHGLYAGFQVGDSLEDIVLAVDEATYQAARILRAEGAVELPNLGRLEIRHGDDGPVGRFIPSEDLHPLAAAAD